MLAPDKGAVWSIITKNQEPRIAATAVWQPVRRIWLCVSSVKTTPAKTELSLSNIDSAHFTKDDFDPSNDLKVSLRIKPQKVRFVRRMLLFTTKFSNANCETSTAGISRKPTQEGGYVCSITQRTQVH